jgi:hypothetical protein
LDIRKNAKGLCVKDPCIQQKALNLFNELHPEVQAGKEFKSSKGTELARYSIAAFYSGSPVRSTECMRA